MKTMGTMKTMKKMIITCQPPSYPHPLIDILKGAMRRQHYEQANERRKKMEKKIDSSIEENFRLLTQREMIALKSIEQYRGADIYRPDYPDKPVPN